MKDGKLMALYDENCSLCQQTRKVMEKLDWFHRVDWVSLQTYEQLHGGQKFKPVDLRKELHIMDKTGKVLIGFHAVRRLFLQFPLTILVGLVMHFPFASFVGTPVYRWIAANRYKLFRTKCENGSCSLH